MLIYKKKKLKSSKNFKKFQKKKKKKKKEEEGWLIGRSRSGVAEPPHANGNKNKKKYIYIKNYGFCSLEVANLRVCP